MAIKGHPWADRELDELRAAQRRWLRAQPTWRLDRQPIPRLPDPPTSDRVLLETLLRLKANELIDAIEVRFDDLEGEAGQVANDWVRSVLANIGHFDTLYDVVADVANDTSRLVGRSRTIDQSEWVPTLAATAFAAWADDLADDGYVDSRIEAGRTPR